MKIRRTNAQDIYEIENIHVEAFGKKKGAEIADLVNGLFNDDTAFPLISLAAVEDDQLIGHILFTKVEVVQTAESVKASILAPLAVLPEAQKKGVGAVLINKGFELLKTSGGDLVFVLGHPSYYPRSGFMPAGALGFEAPYPIPDIHADAWMVRELSSGFIGRVKGRVKCSAVLNQPQHWRE